MVYGYAHDKGNNFHCERCYGTWVYADELSGLDCIEITCVTCGNVWYIDRKYKRIPADCSKPRNLPIPPAHMRKP